ncbi:MAG: type II toxin-antitoxin system HipA family toxin [Dermatophilaceae bacterium]
MASCPRWSRRPTLSAPTSAGSALTRPSRSGSGPASRDLEHRRPGTGPRGAARWGRGPRRDAPVPREAPHRQRDIHLRAGLPGGPARLRTRPDPAAGRRITPDTAGSGRLWGDERRGPRPKAAVVLDDGATLAIAKLPRRGSDEWDVMGWEKVTLDLAAAAQLTVPRSHLVQVLGRKVLLTERFDRRRTLRVGFVSAMTMLEAHDGDQRSYLEIADTIETQSPAPGRDLEQLFRRIVFSVLVSNTDDHLRNHGFLREPTGWTLSPAFDLNPNPEAPGTLSTTIDTDGDPTASIDRALQTAQMYRLSPTRATEIIDEVEQATATWRTVATRLELPAPELELMRAAFDTPERTTARAIVTQHRTFSTVSPARVGQPQPRRPRGTPTAGQYAPQPRSQPDGQR